MIYGWRYCQRSWNKEVNIKIFVHLLPKEVYPSNQNYKKCVELLTIEVEYMAITEAYKETLLIKRLLKKWAEVRELCYLSWASKSNPFELEIKFLFK